MFSFSTNSASFGADTCNSLTKSGDCAQELARMRRRSLREMPKAVLAPKRGRGPGTEVVKVKTDEVATALLEADHDTVTVVDDLAGEKG